MEDSRAVNKTSKDNKTGVWIVGARGDIASTLIVGTEALKKGQISSNGMTTEIPPISNLDLIELDELVIGGLDIVEDSLIESARAVGQRSGTFSTELVNLITPELNAIDQDIVCEPLATWQASVQPERSLDISSFINQIRKHLHDFSEMFANFVKAVWGAGPCTSIPQLRIEASEANAYFRSEADTGNTYPKLLQTFSSGRRWP